MSYILEALKKSDQERQRGQMPGLQTVQTPVAGRPRTGRRVWPYVLAAALLLNAAVLAWWLSPWQSGKQEIAAQKLAAVQPSAEKTAATPAQPAPVAATAEALASAKQSPKSAAKVPSGAVDKAAAAQPAAKAEAASAAGVAAQSQKASPAPEQSGNKAAQTAAPVEPAKPSPEAARAVAKSGPNKSEPARQSPGNRPKLLPGIRSRLPHRHPQKPHPKSQWFPSTSRGIESCRTSNI